MPGLILGIRAVAAFACLWACFASCQVTKGEAAPVSNGSFPVHAVDLTHVDPIIGLPASTVVGYPQICSSDGTIFTEIYAVSEKETVATFPDIYAISEKREVQRITIPKPIGYGSMSFRSLYPSETKLIFLIQASRPTDPTVQLPRGQVVPFLSVVGRYGEDQKLMKVDQLPFQLVKAAIIDSGEILVLGMDTANITPVLAKLHEDGSLDKILDLDFRSYTTSQDLKGAYQEKPKDTNTLSTQRPVMGALNKAQFVPWGSEVLLIQPGTTFPVYRLSGGGVKAAVTIKPPDGYLLQTLLGSSKSDSWVVLFSDPIAFQKVANGQVVENIPQKLMEVDPYTGAIKGELSVKGPLPGEVLCGANHKVSSTYYGLPSQQNLPDELTYASAPR